MTKGIDKKAIREKVENATAFELEKMIAESTATLETFEKGDLNLPMEAATYAASDAMNTILYAEKQLYAKGWWATFIRRNRLGGKLMTGIQKAVKKDGLL